MMSERQRQAHRAAQIAMQRESGRNGYFPSASTAAQAVAALWEIEADSLETQLAASLAREARLTEALEWIREGLDGLYSETNPHGMNRLPETLVPYAGPIASMHKTALIALEAAAAAPAAGGQPRDGEEAR